MSQRSRGLIVVRPFVAGSLAERVAVSLLGPGAPGGSCDIDHVSDKPGLEVSWVSIVARKGSCDAAGHHDCAFLFRPSRAFTLRASGIASATISAHEGFRQTPFEITRWPRSQIALHVVLVLAFGLRRSWAVWIAPSIVCVYAPAFRGMRELAQATSCSCRYLMSTSASSGGVRAVRVSIDRTCPSNPSSLPSAAACFGALRSLCLATPTGVIALGWGGDGAFCSPRGWKLLHMARSSRSHRTADPALESYPIGPDFATWRRAPQSGISRSRLVYRVQFPRFMWVATDACINPFAQASRRCSSNGGVSRISPVLAPPHAFDTAGGGPSRRRNFRTSFKWCTWVACLVVPIGPLQGRAMEHQLSFRGRGM